MTFMNGILTNNRDTSTTIKLQKMKNKYFIEIISNLKMYKIYSFALLLFCLFITSCNNLPNDLEDKRKSLNAELTDLRNREETASNNSDYEQLLNDYKAHKINTINYRNELTDRGFKNKINEKVLIDIEEQILKYQDLVNSNIKNESYSSDSSHSSNKTCSWCDKSFSGSHYTHLGKMSDCYSTDSSSSIGKYCSMRCCSEARKSSCPSCR